jgi:hypothetical protein
MTFKPLDRLAGVLIASLAIGAGGNLMGALPDAWFDGSSFAGESAVVTLLKAGALIGIGGLVIVSAIASIVLFLVWMNRAAWNLRALRPGGVFGYTPGWCVGWWFIPFANLVQPYRAMKEIWQHSDAGDAYGQVPQLLTGWWTMWILSEIGDRAAMKADSSAVTWVSAILDVGAAVMCALVVRRVTAMQRELAARQDATLGRASATTPFVG